MQKNEKPTTMLVITKELARILRIEGAKYDCFNLKACANKFIIDGLKYNNIPIKEQCS